MGKRISDETRMKQNRGTGHGKNYKPWIHPRELKSLSTTSAFYDPRIGRQVSLLSEGEKMVYLTLSWRDDVAEIREQFPLALRETLSIAEQNGIRHPMAEGKYIVMTSDFLVDFIDGKQRVFSVKAAEKDMGDQRTAEKLFIEKTYWKNKGIDFVMIYKDIHINEVYATNIRAVMAYYDQKDVHSTEDLVMHLIAHKIIITDMTVKNLPIKQLAERLKRSPLYLKYSA